MLKIFYLRFLIFCLLLCTNCYSKSYVTYEFSGGRFGDCLISYLHAKWISHKFDIPLIIKPFTYSDVLSFGPNDFFFENLEIDITKIKKQRIKTPSSLTNILRDNESTLYVVPFFPEDKYELEWFAKRGQAFPYFEVDWSDHQFRKSLVGLFSKRENFELIQTKTDFVNIAIHVRDGGGFDSDAIRSQHPTKFPPITYYITALNEVSDLLDGKKIYCHLFTDAIQPETIIDILENSFQNKNIVFGFHYHNDLSEGVLIDFFSLFNFDVIIMPNSNFSRIPTLVQDFPIIASPKAILKNKSMYISNTVDIKVNKTQYKALIENNKTSL